ncbi:MAG: helix-turn-helix transcriptional regulator, partial [Arcobacter sp.]|nr:helix-turn-helix transcriptional regulator [Arcobacter sp.]
DYLKRYFKDDFEENILIKNNQTDIKTLTCINEILNSPYLDKLNDLFVESKVLEILANEFFNLHSLKEKPKNQKNIILSDEDIYSLNKAKEILIKTYTNPPSIKELAKQVAINEFKLKSGFKLLFKTTPYSLVRQYRMVEAKNLLLNTDLNISEVSSKIGFKNQGHFTKNFFDSYGILPKEIRKTRKYYY